MEISEEVAFQSLLDGSNRFLGPEESMRIQSALGSDIALTFDECTPAHADRDYGALHERTHRWLDRCLVWHEREGPADQAVFGIVQGGVDETCAATRSSASRRHQSTGSRSAGRSSEGEMRPRLRRRCSPMTSRHLLGIGEVDDLLAGIEMGIDLFDCAIPTRIARHGAALAPEPEGRFRIDLTKAGFADDDRPIAEGCPCEACRRHSRAYLHHLARSRDLTGTRLLTLHNLTYIEQLVSGARGAIADGRFPAYSDGVLRGAAP